MGSAPRHRFTSGACHLLASNFALQSHNSSRVENGASPRASLPGLQVAGVARIRTSLCTVWAQWLLQHCCWPTNALAGDRREGVTRGGDCNLGSSLRAPVTAPTCPFRPPQARASYTVGCQWGPRSAAGSGTQKPVEMPSPGPHRRKQFGLRSEAGPALNGLARIGSATRYRPLPTPLRTVFG